MDKIALKLSGIHYVLLVLAIFGRFSSGYIGTDLEPQDVTTSQCTEPCHYDGDGHMNCSARACKFPPEFDEISFWKNIDGYVRILDLHGNQISNVTSLHEFEYLTELDLTCNGVRDIEAGAFKLCTNLEILNLAENSLKQIDNDIFEDLNGLKVLNLSGNLLTNIDEDLFRKYLRSLDTLILKNNRITTIDSYSFFNLNALRILHLEHNELRQVTSAMLGGLQVEQLHLDYNFLTAIPELSVASTMGLQYISLSNNRISQLDELAFLTASDMLFLNLSYNRIREIPVHSFEDTNKLEQLILDGNPLEEIKPGVLPKSLKKFSLQVCPIISIITVN